MKQIKTLSVVFTITATLAACDNSAGTAQSSNDLLLDTSGEQSPVIDDGSAIIANERSIESNPTDNTIQGNTSVNTAQNTVNNDGNQNRGGNDQGGNNRTRSPQGITDGARERRDTVRDGRRNGNQRGPILIDNREIQTFDGTNNNLQNANWGASFSHLQRIAAATYSDGVNSMVFTDRAGPREISNTIINQAEGESIPNQLGASDFNWQWGQFIDHDIDLTDAAEEEQNIAVPAGDPFFDPAGTGTAIIPFNRALYDPDTGTDASNVREQENEITSWIDGSMVYGSNDERALALRVGPDSPFMKVSAGNLLPFNSENLINANGPVPDPTTLFLAGDVRVNEQAGLATMHTLFVREHNRLARLIMDQSPELDAEAVYQAARRLVIAEIQMITYDEHLPALVGPGAIDNYRGYDPSINPTIYNEFSAAAFRLGHSMVSDTIQRLDANNNTIAGGPLSLRDAFFTAPQLLQAENDIDPILRGLASQVHQAVDAKVIHTLRNLLFGAPGSGGLDLISLNIQRGRDHGLPYYNDMRIAMGLTPIDSFEQISNDSELNQSLQDAYGDVDKIDLWVGGLAESPLLNLGSQLGELFRAVVIKQFTELRDGDRFWYQNYLTENELAMVEGTTLAQVIRNNTSIGNEIPDNVFFVAQ